MKWLIVTQNTSDMLVSILDSLKKREADTEVIRIDSLNNLIYQNDNSEIAFDILKKIVGEITHCVLLFSENFMLSSKFMYLTGLLCGKNVPVFISKEYKKTQIEKCFSNLNFYKSENDFDSLLEENYEAYSNLEAQEKSKRKLYKKGLPFTPDAFSFQVAKGNMEDCELFVTAGMSVNVSDSSGTPLLCVAARSQRPEMIDFLMKNDGNINAVSKDRGYSPLMDSVWRNNAELVKTVVSYKPDLNLVCNDGQTPLVLAVGNGNEEICDVLLRYGADPDVKDHMNMSAIQYAKLFKKEAIVKIFEKYEKKD